MTGAIEARRPAVALAVVCGCTLLVVGLVAAINLAVPQLLGRMLPEQWLLNSVT